MIIKGEKKERKTKYKYKLNKHLIQTYLAQTYTQFVIL